MAKLHFPDFLLSHTGGTRELELDCRSYCSMVRELEARWPGIGEALKDTAVAIDGQICQDAWLESLGTASEVYFMPRMEGG